MPELFLILWHPEGQPVEITGVRCNGYPYAKTTAGHWWRLSEESPVGWRVPVVRVHDAERVGQLETIFGLRGVLRQAVADRLTVEKMNG